MKHSRNLALFLLAVPVLLGALKVTPAQQVPNPAISITKTELFEQGGKKYVKYHFAVDNKDAFPADLFAAAPDLPPCGKNTNASRTWVDLYARDGKRLNGFCAFTKVAELGDVWFALEDGVLAPSWIYIELTDRKTNTKYKSNLSETSQ
jgi:hypothetical protein